MSLFWLSGRDTGLRRCRDWTREHQSGSSLPAPGPALAKHCAQVSIRRPQTRETRRDTQRQM